MKKGILIIILSLILIFSLNSSFATDLTNNSVELTLENSVNNNAGDISNSLEDIQLENNLVEDSSNRGDSLEIYVGQNITADGGNGSYFNPFNSLNRACESVNGENNVVVNIFDGTYYLDSYLKFNTTNLTVNGMGSFVIIKNADNERHTLALGLVSSDSTFVMNNLIYDASDYTVTTSDMFTLFYGNVNLGIYNNCSFIGTKTVKATMSGADYNSEFNNCYFESTVSKTIFYNKFTAGTTHRFDNCIFNLPNAVALGTFDINTNVTLNNCWFGENTLSLNAPPNGYKRNGNKNYRGEWIIPVNRYAQFSAYENYLGNNQYEIVGKLVWNGTNNNDGMENFQPMNVTLSSRTGIIQSNAILENGTFRAIYTSNSSEHEITALLCSQSINVNFNSINLTVDAPSIYYGEDQNISVKLPQVFNGNVSIIVNNKTYNLTFNDTDAAIYTVEDILTEGNYTVEVLFIDEENHLYGSNSTVLSVSKINNYVFDVVPSSEVKVGENATVAITLPGDVEGNVTIKFGNDTKFLPANQTMVVNFNNLNATTYPVTVIYTGSDKYTGKEKVDSITVDKADSSVSVDDSVFTYGDVIAIPFNATNASGVNVRVLNKDDVEVANTTSKCAEFVLDTLSAGEYTLEVTTIVNDNYEEFTADNIDLTINKAGSDLTLNDSYEFTYGENAVINVVTENSTGDVIVSLDGFTANVSGNEITLPTLNVGKYTLNVTTNPDENHNNTTKTTTIIINKAAPSMNVIVEPVENITTKDDITLTISLPSDATGEVIIKINGKKTDIKSANETITINLNNQAGDHVVDVTYSGDKNYESDMATKEYTVSKVETSITANPILFEEGNTSTIEINIQDVDSGFILVDVKGKKFYGDINSGKATVLIEGLVAGNYTANIIFAGDEKFNKTTGTVAVNVTPTVDVISELQEIIKELNSTIESQAKEIGNLTDTVAIQNSTIESQAKEIGNLTDTVAIQNSTIESQAKEIGNLTDTVNNQSSTIESQAKEIGNLTDTVNNQSSTIESQAKEIGNLTDTVNNQSSTIESQAKEIGNLTDTVNNQSSTIESQAKEIGNLTDTVNNQSSTIESQAKEIGNLTDTVAIQNSTIESQAKEIGNLTDTVAIQNSTIESQAKEIGNLTDTVNNQSSTIESQKEQIGNLTKQINKKDAVLVVDQTFTRAAVDYNAGERGGMFYAILKDSEGKALANKTVQIAINGKIYNRTTDNEGKAGIQVNLASANTYSYAVSFQGDDQYNAAPIAVSKLTVTKKKTTIKASNKVFKAKTKTKKISITLKTVKNQYDKKTYLKSGKKVTLKVNGKTYTAKINKKGVAKFTIKITKKGKYTAKIKFAGDKTYKASSKTIKIRIK